MRTDPSDNGGLFLGRRPGTAPTRFRNQLPRGGPSRRSLDACLAGVAFALTTLVGLLCWGPIPLACLWVGSRVNYLTGSISLGILMSFAALFALLFGALQIMHDIDQLWVILRRAAGHDQRRGALERIFAATAVICATIFVFWFLVIHGPGSTEYSGVQVLGKTFPR
ncbi:MAG: hypothetical protein ACHQE6_11860 [Solirubrobacterales bacterium]